MAIATAVRNDGRFARALVLFVMLGAASGCDVEPRVDGCSNARSRNVDGAGFRQDESFVDVTGTAEALAMCAERGCIDRESALCLCRAEGLRETEDGLRATLGLGYSGGPVWTVSNQAARRSECSAEGEFCTVYAPEGSGASIAAWDESCPGE
jgi:hypothetical protein